MTTYTTEQKKEYFKQLRERWSANKTNADNDTDAKVRYEAIMRETNGKFSYYSYYFTLCDMRKNGFEGNPYVDCKTFNGWRAVGYKVKKGAKSKITGITWLSTGKDDDGDEFIYPKMYHLFHSSQVEPIN